MMRADDSKTATTTNSSTRRTCFYARRGCVRRRAELPKDVLRNTYRGVPALAVMTYQTRLVDRNVLSQRRGARGDRALHVPYIALTVLGTRSPHPEEYSGACSCATCR
jgi:hypothetical protein